MILQQRTQLSLFLAHSLPLGGSTFWVSESEDLQNNTLPLFHFFTNTSASEFYKVSTHQILRLLEPLYI